MLLVAKQPFERHPKTSDPLDAMRRIVDDTYTVKFPSYVSPEAVDLIQRLLQRRPIKRLGMLSQGARDVMEHPWFAGFDWEALAARRMPAPRLPQAADRAKRLADLAASTEAAAAASCAARAPAADASGGKPVRRSQDRSRRSLDSAKKNNSLPQSPGKASPAAAAAHAAAAAAAGDERGSNIGVDHEQFKKQQPLQTGGPAAPLDGLTTSSGTVTALSAEEERRVRELFSHF